MIHSSRKKRPILAPFQRENRKIQGVGQKRKVQQTLEFTGLFWRRVRDSNPRDLSVYSISSLLCNCDGGVRFGVVSVSPVPAESRLKSGFFARKALRDRLFLKVGSNRHFFRFWREMREDRREKSGDGHTPQNRASNRRKSIFEVLQMDVFPVNWDSVPEVMNKEQFFRICHISKSTALHLLKSGKVPCEWSGKKTRCYKIRKEDVKAYLEERAIFPELYSAPKGWYGTHYVARLSKELPEDTLRQMHGYYEKLLRKYPDVVTVKDVVALTGYTLTTVHNWCSRGSLKAFQKGLKFCIPKIFLVDFFCSLTFRSITRKSLWHIQTLNDFSRKMKHRK